MKCSGVLWSVVERCVVECFGMLWSVVECCGVLWSVVECCGVLWSVVECCGVLWSVLECCGVLWRSRIQGQQFISSIFNPLFIHFTFPTILPTSLLSTSSPSTSLSSTKLASTNTPPNSHPFNTPPLSQSSHFFIFPYPIHCSISLNPSFLRTTPHLR